MNDMLNDDDIIARLRSALDEVAASSATDADVVPIRAAGLERRSRRTWLSVAAASAVLLGAGGWALSQRSSAPVGGQATTPSLTPTTLATATVPPTGTGDPWFELHLPDAEAGGVVTNSTANSFKDTGTQLWLVAKPGGDGRQRGLLSIEVHYNRLELPSDMSGYTEVAGAPQGTAWLRTDIGAGTAGPHLVWQRDDAVWWVSEVGLIDPAAGGASAFANSVFRIEKGTFNDLLTNPDPQAEWWGTLSNDTRTTYAQGYTIGGTPRGAVLAVTNTALLDGLTGFSDFTEVGVAGSRGFLATLATGESVVVWPAAPTWWATLRIDAALSSRTSEILAAVTAANSVAPPTTATTIGTETSVPVGDPSAKPADAPSYAINDSTLTKQGSATSFNPGTTTTAMPRGAVWEIAQTGPGASPGYVFATAFNWGGLPYQVDGVNYRDVSRNGVQSVLYIGDATANPPVDPKVYFPQADGVVWVYEAANLVAPANDPYGALVDLAFSLSNSAAIAGTGTSAAGTSGDQPGITLIGDGSLPATEYDDTYTTQSGGTVKLTVAEGFAPAALRDATQVTPTTVLGRKALVGTFADGTTKIVWQAADGSRWWASLGFSDAATAAQADTVIASLASVSASA